MKVLNASIWVYKPHVVNDHVLQILVDKIPKESDMRFREKNGLYYAEKDGYVRFYYWSGKGNDGGFYGRAFEIIMEDGSKKILEGPWSSRSGAINKYFKPHCMEVSITDDPEAFERGYTFYAGAITVDLARDILNKFLPEWMIVKEIKWEDEIHYKVVRKDDPEDKRNTEWFKEFLKNEPKGYSLGRRYIPGGENNVG